MSKLLTAAPVKPVCTCRAIYRYHTATYLSGGRIVTQSQWNFLKSKSVHCERCKKLGRRLFHPQEDAREVGAAEVHIEAEELKHGGLYQSQFVEESRDYETGCTDSWSWLMKPYTEG
jgi:hypothetical protein